MANKMYEGKSLEELQKMAKTISLVTGLLIGMLAVLIGLNIYLMVAKGANFGASMVVPIALLPIVFLNLNNLRGIKAEIKSRG